MLTTDELKHILDALEFHVNFLTNLTQWFNITDEKMVLIQDKVELMNKVRQALIELPQKEERNE